MTALTAGASAHADEIGGMGSAAASDETPPTTADIRLPAGRRATLERRDAHGEWQRVCDAPCRLTVPANAAFRVVRGDGRPPTVLALEPGVVHDVDVYAGDVAQAPASTQHRAGVALSVVGAVALAPAAGVTLGVFAMAVCPERMITCSTPGDVAEAYGSPFVLVPLVIGAVTFGIGSALLVTDDRAPKKAASRTATLVDFTF